MPEAKQKIINGETFTITTPYLAGHVLTEVEAKVLNQVRAENIGNNLRETVKEALEARDKGDASKYDGLAELVSKYDAEYTFSMGGGGGGATRLDPIEREAKSLAEAYVREDLKKKGRKWAQIPDGLTEEEWVEKRTAVVEKLMASEGILKLAKKRVSEKGKVADAIGDVSL
jgi:hypothetical protein